MINLDINQKMLKKILKTVALPITLGLTSGYIIKKSPEYIPSDVYVRFVLLQNSNISINLIEKRLSESKRDEIYSQIVLKHLFSDEKNRNNFVEDWILSDIYEYYNSIYFASLKGYDFDTQVLLGRRIVDQIIKKQIKVNNPWELCGLVLNGEHFNKLFGHIEFAKYDSHDFEWHMSRIENVRQKDPHFKKWLRNNFEFDNDLKNLIEQDTYRLEMWIKACEGYSFGESKELLEFLLESKGTLHRIMYKNEYCENELNCFYKISVPNDKNTLVRIKRCELQATHLHVKKQEIEYDEKNKTLIYKE